MKILVTGASGFVGTNISEHLADKYEIIGTDMNRQKEHTCNMVVGDLLDRRMLETLFKRWDFDVILHFAAQARVDPSFADPIGTYRANVETTINLLEIAKTKNIRFIVASSEIIYGKADEYPCKEHFHLRPDSPYAASKAALDLMVQQVPNTVVIRSGMGYGPRSPPSQVITKFILTCMRGGDLTFPTSTSDPVVHPTRDVNYIGNFVRGIEQLLEHPEISGVFNMGSGQEVDLLSLARKVIATVGNGEIVYSSNFHYRHGEEGKRTWLDNSKAQEAFGYEPQIKLDEGLQMTYDWLKKGGRKKYGW